MRGMKDARLKAQEDTVIFCPKCGHSVQGGQYAMVLAQGSDNCGTTLKIISLTEWREIADQSDLKLTRAGKLILGGSP